MPFVDIETFFIFVWVFDMNVYVCVPGMCLVSIDIRRGHQIPWKWSYIWLGSTMCQELNLGPQQESVFLTTQPSHQPLCWYFCTEITFLDIIIKIPFMYLRKKDKFEPNFWMVLVIMAKRGSNCINRFCLLIW